MPKSILKRSTRQLLKQAKRRKAMHGPHRDQHASMLRDIRTMGGGWQWTWTPNGRVKVRT